MHRKLSLKSSIIDQNFRHIKQNKLKAAGSFVIFIILSILRLFLNFVKRKQKIKFCNTYDIPILDNLSDFVLR